jgi:hypothetical protein
MIWYNTTSIEDGIITHIGIITPIASIDIEGLYLQNISETGIGQYLEAIII